MEQFNSKFPSQHHYKINSSNTSLVKKLQLLCQRGFREILANTGNFIFTSSTLQVTWLFGSVQVTLVKREGLHVTVSGGTQHLVGQEHSSSAAQLKQSWGELEQASICKVSSESEGMRQATRY